MLGKCQVLLCDGDESVKDGLCAFANSNLFEIDWAMNVGHAVSAFVETVYDVVVLEIDLPGRSGLELIGDAFSFGVTSLVFSRYPEGLLGVHAIRLGASGYVEKKSSLRTLFDAVGRVDAGGKWISSDLASLIAQSMDRPVAPHDKLSSREFTVFISLASGQTIAEIASDLCIAETTVRAYVARIKDKMGISRVWEIYNYAHKNGLV